MDNLSLNNFFDKLPHFSIFKEKKVDQSQTISQETPSDIYTSGQEEFSKTTLKTSAPTQTIKQKETITGRLMGSFLKVNHLLKKVWPNRPLESDYRLFAEIFKIDTLQKLNDRSLLDILKWKINWLKHQTKSLNVPDSLIKELETCENLTKKWKTLNSKKLLSPVDRVKFADHVKKQVESVQNLVDKMQPNESLLLPGNFKNTLFRLTKQPDGTFKLSVFSLEEIEGKFEAPSKGRVKRNIEIEYNNLDTNQVHRTVSGLIHGILDRDEQGKQTKGANLKKILSPIASNRETKIAPERLRAKKTSPQQIINSLVESVIAPEGKHREDKVQRSKLWEEFTTFSSFFKASYNHLDEPGPRNLIQTGVNSLSRKVALLHSKQQISDEECSFFQKELEAVQNQLLSKAEGKKTPTSPLKEPGSKSHLHLRNFDSKEISEAPRVALQPIQEQSGNVRTQANSLPKTLKTEYDVKTTPLPDFNTTDGIQKLSQLQVQCENLVNEGKLAFAQDRILQIYRELPLPDLSDKDNPFSSLSVEQKKEYSQNLSKLAALLKQTYESSHMSYSDAAVILKATQIQYLLNVGLEKASVEESGGRRELCYAGFSSFDGILRALSQSWEEKGRFAKIHLDDSHNYNAILNQIISWNGVILQWRDPSNGVFTKDELKDMEKKFCYGKGPYGDDLVGGLPQAIKLNIPGAKVVGEMIIAPDMIITEEKIGVTDEYLNWAAKEYLPFSSETFWNALSHPLNHYGDFVQQRLVSNPYAKGFGIKGDPASQLKENYLEREDAADLILQLSSDCSVHSIMGFLNKKNHLLSNSDVRSWCELLLLQRSYNRGKLEEPKILKVWKEEPEFRREFPAFLKGQIERSIADKKGDHLLFYLKITERLSAMADTYGLSDLKKALPETGDYIKTAADLSTQKDHPFQNYRYHFFQKMLLQYKDKDKLSGEDIASILKYLAYMRSSAYDPTFLNQHTTHQLQSMLEKFSGTIQKQLEDPQFRNGILDEVCKIQGKSLPEASWEGTFPIFQANGLEINLLQPSGGSLPPHLIKHPFIRKKLSDKECFLTPCTISSTEDKNLYQLRNENGHLMLITEDKKNQKIVIHKQLNLGNKEIWLQVPKDEILPDTLLDSEYQSLVNSQNPREIYLCDKEDHIKYILKVSPSMRIEQMAEVDDPSDIRWKEVSGLGESSHPIIRTLKRFARPEDFIVYREEGQIARVEIPRFDLSFEANEDKSGIVCASPPYKKWKLEENSNAPMHKKGIPHVLILTHPDDPNKKAAIVPEYRPGNFTTENKAAPSKADTTAAFSKIKFTFGNLQNLIRKKTQGFRLQLPKETITYGSDKLKPELMHFEVDPYTGEWRSKGENKTENYVNLAYVALSENNPAQAYTFLKQAIDNDQGREEARKSIHNIIKYISGMRGTSPASFGVALLLLHELHRREDRDVTPDMLVTFYKNYLDLGNKIPSELRLSPEQEEIFQSATLELDPKFAAAQFPGLLKVNPPSTPKIKPVKKDLEVSEEQTKALATVLSYDPESRKKFFEFYNGVLSSSPSSVPTLTQKIKQFKITELDEDFEEILIKYLDTVLEMREADVDISLFPVAESSETQALEKFFDELNNLIAFQKIQLTEEEEKIISYVKSVVKDYPTNPAWVDMPWQHFDTTKTTQVAPPAPLTIKDHNDALFEVDKLTQYFKSGKKDDVSIHVDFSSLDQSSQAQSVQYKAKKLQQDIADAKEARQKEDRFVIKNETERQQLLENVSSQKNELQKIAEEKKSKVLALLSSQETPQRKLEQAALLRPTFNWDSMMIATLKNDTKAMKEMFPDPAKLNEFKQLMTEYLLAAMKQKRLESAEGLLKSMSPELEGITPDQSQKLYELLTQERQYDPKTHLNLMTLELYLGFLLRKGQLKSVEDLITNPSCVRQAITGAGKTTVILLLTALLKANGDNISTMVYPSHLFKENLADLEKQLGAVFHRSVYPLKFSIGDPLTMDVEGVLFGKKPSVFRNYYQQLLKTMDEKGVVVTTKETLYSLEQMYILLLDKYAKSRNPQDKEHLVYLHNILGLMRKKQDITMDEFDSALTPKERQELTLGEGVRISENLYTGTLDLYKRLLAYDARHPSDGLSLGLAQNLQGDRYKANGKAALTEVRNELIKEWTAAKASALPPEEARKFTEELTAYLNGDDDLFIKNEWMKDWEPKEKDALALQKDCLTVYLPLALERTGQVHYIRSENGRETVPTLRTNVPKEGSKPDEILEHVCYTIQDYIQFGVKKEVFITWLKAQINAAHAEYDPEVYPSLDATPTGKAFSDLFKDIPLSSVNPKNFDTIYEKVAKRPETTQQFLKLELPKLRISDQKISCTTQNLVSMSHHTGGASATVGALDALHRNIDTKGAETKGAMGEMMLLIKEKTAAAGNHTVQYDPSKPGELFKIAQNNGATGCIDSASVLRGWTNEEFAKNVIEHQPENSPVEGVKFFDDSGKIKTMTAKGVEEGDFSPQKTTFALDQGSSIGTDVKINPKGRVLITANPYQTSIDFELQAAGRLRGRGQQIVWATPQDSGLKNEDDILREGAVFAAHQDAENIMRAKEDELRDIVRNSIFEKLLSIPLSIPLTMEDDSGLDDLIDNYNKFAEDPEGLLISRKDVDYSVPGSYFERNKHLHKKDKRPEEVLQESLQRYQDCSERLGLDDALKTLDSIKYDKKLISQMPDFVEGNQGANVNAQLATNTATFTETQTEVATKIKVSGAREFERGFWIDPSQYKEHYFHAMADSQYGHSSYDKRLYFTENMFPVWGEAYKKRNPLVEDDRNPIHWLYCEYDNSGNPTKITAVDNLEVERGAHKISDPANPSAPEAAFSFYYNMRFHNMVFKMDPANPAVDKSTALSQSAELLAQVRFFDKQMEEKDYGPEQWAALKNWLTVNKGRNLEQEFCKGLSEDKLKRYQQTSLYRLFRTLD